MFSCFQVCFAEATGSVPVAAGLGCYLDHLASDYEDATRSMVMIYIWFLTLVLFYFWTGLDSSSVVFLPWFWFWFWFSTGCSSARV